MDRIPEIGPQYPKDRQLDPSGFLEAARYHQSRFRAERLRLPYENYGNFLTPEDSIAGRNFYSGSDVFSAARKRYPKHSVKVYGNMLRSEHIPLNLFHPLNSDDVLRMQVFSTLLHRPLRSVGQIIIEHAPSPAIDHLNDRSSFDAYFECQDHRGRTGLVGIEVKYTERAYPLKSGSKEERDVNDRTSRYFKVMARSNIFRTGTEPELITDEFRQIWRNQLLGESILQKNPDQLSFATLLMVFPERNQHVARACAGYSELLETTEGKFMGLTYERFISVCRSHARTREYTEWLDYLQDRYIVQ